jgi:hypothetical protein
MSLSRQMLDVIGDLPAAGDDGHAFYRGAFQILVAALANLPEGKRKVFLAEIEGGWLREMVREFIARRRARAKMN